MHLHRNRNRRSPHHVHCDYSRRRRTPPRRAIRRHRSSVLQGRRRTTARLRTHRAHARHSRGQPPVGAAPLGAVRPGARRSHGQPGRADGASRPQGHLSLGLAGGRRREPRGPDVPRPVALSREQRPRRGAPDQLGAGARGSDRARRGQEPEALVRPHHRRRGGRVRRPAQRVRTHEVDDRGGRRGRALRRSARQREEVRPHGRQGAHPHERLHSYPGRGAPRRGRVAASRRSSSRARTRTARSS